MFPAAVFIEAAPRKRVRRILRAVSAGRASLPVDAALAADLARMTPMLADVDLSALDLGGVTEITIDMNLYAGTPGAQQTEEQA